MKYTTENAQALIQEWYDHNRRHHCYYENGPDSAFDRCPAEHDTLRDFMRSRDFPVSDKVAAVLGYKLDEQNFRLRRKVAADARHDDALEENRDVLTERLKQSIDRLEASGRRVDEKWLGGAEKPQEPAERAGSNTVDSQYHEYYKSRIDDLETKLVEVQEQLSVIIAAVEDRISTDEDYRDFPSDREWYSE